MVTVARRRAGLELRTGMGDRSRKQRQLGMRIPRLLGAVNTGNGHSYRRGRNGELCVTGLEYVPSRPVAKIGRKYRSVRLSERRSAIAF